MLRQTIKGGQGKCLSNEKLKKKLNSNKLHKKTMLTKNISQQNESSTSRQKP